MTTATQALIANIAQYAPLLVCGVLCGFAKIARNNNNNNNDADLSLINKLKLVFVSTISAVVVFLIAKYFIQDYEIRLGLGCAVAILGIDGVLKALREAFTIFKNG